MATDFNSANSLWSLQYADLKEILQDEPSYDEVNVMFSQVKTAYNTLKISAALVLEQDEDVKTLVTKARSDYLEVRKEANKFLEKSKPDKPGDSKPKVSDDEKCSVHFKKMGIPKWDGKLRTYLRFKATFKRLVEKHLPEDLALIRLREEGVNKDTREELMIRMRPTLTSAWDVLDKAFGRANMIRDTILHDVHEIPPVTDLGDVHGIRNLVTELISAREDLKECKRENALGESAFSCVMQKIPTELRREIDREIIEDDMNSADSFELFLSKCESAAAVEEIHALRSEANASSSFLANSLQIKSDTGTKDGENEPRPAGDKGRGPDLRQPGQPGGRRDRRQRKPETGRNSDSYDNSENFWNVCILHPYGQHATDECRTFFGRSATDKKNLLAENQRCQRCFKAHKTDECTAPHKCMEEGCKNPNSHHTMLHAACLTQVLMSTGLNVTRPPKTETERRELDLFLGRLTIRPSHAAYLKAMSRGKPTMVRTSILYDGGATLSQILNSTAKMVGLKPVNTLKNLMMRTAGKMTSENWGQSDLYKVPVYDETGTLVINLNCMGVDYIGEHDGGSFEKIKTFFEDTTDLLDPVHGTIQILVGENHESVFPRLITTRGNVVLSETMFGDIIHGAHQNFFPAETTASGLALSSVLDIAAKCQLTTISNDAPERDPVSTVKARSEAPVTNSCPERLTELQSSDPPLTKVKARSPAQQMSDSTCCQVCAVKIAEETAFDRISSVEETPTCYRCQTCQIGPQMSKEESRRIEIYRSCLAYDAKQKIFYCRYPWKENFQKLPDNKESAVKRLMSLTKSMEREPSLRHRYVAEFEKIIDSNVLVKVTDKEHQEWTKSGGKVFYVAHFAVLNESSSSTPLRVVFDPTVPFKGMKIDDFWEPPPNLIPPIPMLLLRFRERRTPIAMDISKCYWTLHLMREESELHRCLWNKLETKNPIETFRILRNSWGMRPSGSLCTVAMLEIAEKYKIEFPEVYEFVKDNVYVDDGTSSVDNVTSALKLAKNISYVLGQASFKIKHFIIGGKSVNITEEDIPSHVRKPEPQERVLGVLYHSENDDLSICARINFSKKKRGARTEPDVEQSDYDRVFPIKFTLRMYLSVIAMIYDPNGLCSCFTIVLKFELGKIFQLKLGWDAAMPEENAQTCKELIRAIYSLKEVKFARCLTPEGAVGNPTLVIFCDSSQTAYASVAYYSWQLQNGDRESRIAMSKARPWPKSPCLTIPKGEMLACILGVRQKAAIMEKTSFKFERIIFLTDSSIVCGQILHSPSEYNTWTANRLDEIQLLSATDQWFHVRSENNVADLATRGMTPEDFGKGSVWQNGPKFMEKDIESWPIVHCEKVHVPSENQSVDVRIKDPRMKIKPSPSTLLQAEVSQIGDETILKFLENLEISPVDKNDNWMKVKRRIARLIRFSENATNLYRKEKIEKVRTNVPKDFQLLKRAEREKFLLENDKFVPSKRELTIAALYMIKQAQKDLPEDVKRKQASLNPVLDESAVWRVMGRTGQCKGNPPILIPRNHPLAEVLIRYYHTPQHSGADATMTLLRQDFWIVDGPKFANSFVSKCTFCRIMRKQVAEVEIAPKKPEQLLRSPVFANITIDLAGPYETKADRRTTRHYNVSTGKIWVLLIVCRVSQSCHLELMEAYDTDAFLSAFDAFTQLRGKPRSIVADMGSQIRSAAGVLESMWKNVKIPQVRNHDPENIEWTFVPSGAHSSLGQAERNVRIFKKTMEVMTFTRKPELSKLNFQRLLYSIANVMNDRPIGVHRSRTGKLDGDRLLRPNDLIMGRSTADITPLIVKNDCDKNEYTKTITINNVFLERWWQKWHELIFIGLFPREKWTNPGRQMMKGDIVLIKETCAIMNKWTWGEIHEVNFSSDGIIRTTSVRYKPDTGPSTRSKFVTKSVRDLCVILQSDERELEQNA